MGKERQRTRITSKIDQLPEEVKDQINTMLLDTSISYWEISQWLEDEHGEEISKSAVGRYALRTNRTSQRLIEVQQQTNQLVKAIKANPDVDYTDAAMQMLMGGLTSKLAYAQEEFDYMPLDKAGRLVVGIARTEAYKQKVKHNMKKKAELAFEELEEELMKMIKSDPSLAKELKALLEKAKEKVMDDE